MPVEEITNNLNGAIETSERGSNTTASQIAIGEEKSGILGGESIL
jgi:hypothetical protein